jgi:hypothetical protein
MSERSDKRRSGADADILKYAQWAQVRKAFLAPDVPFEEIEKREEHDMVISFLG